MRHPWLDLWQGLKYTSTAPVRFLLALVTFGYGALTIAAEDVQETSCLTTMTSFVLASGARSWWAAAFMVWGLVQFWRILAAPPRPLLAALVNVITLGLWGGITVGTIRSSHVIVPGYIGYFTMLAIALYVLIRTEVTARDRESA